MKAYVEATPVESAAHTRVIDALKRYAPLWVRMVDNPLEADVRVLHVVGRQNAVNSMANSIMENGGRYAVIQYCVRSTQKPETDGWLPLWRNAMCVWSYYDLPMLCAEDGNSSDFEFYHAPLGVDADVFKPIRWSKRPYIIATTGGAWLSESVREATNAAWRVDKPVFHLGADLKRKGVTYKTGISDAELAKMYSQCQFVSGLRRTEGFELPAAEGLLCGARPILFDKPHYRVWYEPWGVFIPEVPRQQTIDELERVFRDGPRPVSGSERNAAKRRFDWDRIVTGFWNRLI